MKNEQLLNLLSGLLLLIVLVSSSFVVSRFLLPQKEKEIEVAQTPQIDQPPVEPQADISEAELLSVGGYRVPSDIFSNQNTYLNESIKLALNGKFKTARLVVEGTIDGSEKYLVSISLGAESGVLNAIRNSANSINMTATANQNGVFTKETGIRFTVDLFGNTALATTRKEFEDTRQVSKLVKFWDFISPPPPTIARFVVAPFNERGEFNGTVINSVKIIYTCEGDNICEAAGCEKNELESNCVKRNFGPVAEAIYKKNVGL